MLFRSAETKDAKKVKKGDISDKKAKRATKVKPVPQTLQYCVELPMVKGPLSLAAVRLFSELKMQRKRRGVFSVRLYRGSPRWGPPGRSPPWA